MINIVVHILIQNIPSERKRFLRHICKTYGYIEYELESVNFLYRPLTTRQYKNLEYKFHDCIISDRLKDRKLGWAYQVRINYCLLT